MKKALLILVLLIGTLGYGQALNSYERHGKLTTAQINAIDTTRTDLTYTAENTELGIEVINRRDGNGWLPRFSGGGIFNVNVDGEYITDNRIASNAFHIKSPVDTEGIGSLNYVSLITQESPALSGTYYGEIITNAVAGGVSTANRLTSVPTSWNILGVNNVGTHIGGSTSPSEKLKVTGNLDITGVYKINGVDVSIEWGPQTFSEVLAEGNVMDSNILPDADATRSIGNITNGLASIYNQSYIFKPLTSDPTYTSNLGQTFYRSDLGKISYWNGSVIQRLANESYVDGLHANAVKLDGNPNALTGSGFGLTEVSSGVGLSLGLTTDEATLSGGNGGSGTDVDIVLGPNSASLFGLSIAEINAGNVTGLVTREWVNSATSAITNALKSATTTVNVSSATAPATGQFLRATSGTAATWQTYRGLMLHPDSPVIIDSLYVGTTAQILAAGLGTDVLSIPTDAIDYSYVQVALSDLSTTLAIGTKKGMWIAPADGTIESPANNGIAVVLDVPGTTTGINIDINKNGTDIATTNVTTDATEASSDTAATDFVLSSYTFVRGDKFIFDIDAVPTAATGAQLILKVYYD